MIKMDKSATVYVLLIQMAELREKIQSGKADINVGSVERYERLASMIVENSANIINGDPAEPYFHASQSVRILEPEFIDDMEEKVRELEQLALSREYPNRINLRVSSTAAPSTAKSSAHPPSSAINQHVSGSEAANDPRASGSHALDVPSLADPRPSTSQVADVSDLVDSRASHPQSTDVANANTASSVSSGVNSRDNTKIVAAEVHVDAGCVPSNHAVDVAPSAPIVPIVAVEINERITASPTSKRVIIDCSVERAGGKEPSPPPNTFPSASIPPAENSHERAVFETKESVPKKHTLDDLFGDDSDDDIPMDAVAEMSQRENRRDNGDVGDQSQEDQASSQLSMNSAQRLINSDPNTPLKDENREYYEDISDEEEGDDKVESGHGSQDVGEGGSEDGRGVGNSDEEEGEEEVNEEGEGDVDVEEGDEEAANEDKTAADMLLQAMQQSDLPTQQQQSQLQTQQSQLPTQQQQPQLPTQQQSELPTSSSDIPAYAQHLVEGGDVQFSRGTTPLRLAPKNGVIPKRYPITTSVTAAAGFHDRNSAAFAAKVRQDAYTKENPLIKDGQKKQVAITSHFSEPVAHQAARQQPSSSNKENGANPSSDRQTVSTSSQRQVFSQQQIAQPTSSAQHRQESSSSSKHANVADSPSDANRPQIKPPSPPKQSESPSVVQQTQQVSPPSNGDQSSTKRKAPIPAASAFRPPKRPNTSIGSLRTSGDLPMVRKDGIQKKSKTFLNNKCCKYCHRLFPGRATINLSAHQHVQTGSCDFLKKNMREIGVNKKCKNCPKEFIYHKGMYQDILDHFEEKNHSCLCHICGDSHLFSDIFSHISSEILDFFSEGIKCRKCKQSFNSAISFYCHLQSVHSVKDKNISVFSKFLIDSHPKFDYLLTALLLTHAKEKS